MTNAETKRFYEQDRNDYEGIIITEEKKKVKR